MKKLTMVVLVNFVLYVFVFSVLSAADNSKQKEQDKKTQASKPILPPVMPSSSSAVSPTPHISAPQVTPASIDMDGISNKGAIDNHIPNAHTTPAYATVPIGQVQASFPQPPAIKSVIGILLDIGLEEDGTRWLRVKDQVSTEVLTIKVIDTDNTHVIKKAVIVRFEDIKIGDTVNIVFSAAGEDNIANFISILTKEQVEMWKKKLDRVREE